MVKITRKYRKAKGFTLVELLIVIIIIGILAGMMMLAAGSATDKAEATKIVSNMRNIKAAAVMYYADKGDWPVSDTNNAALNNYLDQSLLGKGYSVKQITGTSNDYRVEATVSDDNVLNKIKDMAANSAVSVDGQIATMPIN